MAVTLELRPEVEANLAAKARARGMSLDAYLRRVIEELSSEDRPLAGGLQELWAALDELPRAGEKMSSLPTSALSREGIYLDHD